jgi:hypothetical protein
MPVTIVVMKLSLPQLSACVVPAYAAQTYKCITLDAVDAQRAEHLWRLERSRLLSFASYG